jgi:uncharacterized protein YbbC (DUF1343 family)
MTIENLWKFLLVTCLFLILPRTLYLYSSQDVNHNLRDIQLFKLGIDNISTKILRALKSKKWALICNSSSINAEGKRTLDVLLKADVKITKLIAPEHGATGKYQAEHDVPDGKDAVTKLPIYSAHKSGKDGRKISDTILKDVDGILFDIQDVGMRHYTYVSTMCEAIDSAKNNNKTVIVFDRPNPLGGLIDGPLVKQGYESFISRINIPLRHGLTVGECAKYYNFYKHNNKVKLIVVPMLNYHRLPLSEELAVGLSPNIPNLTSCQSYSFGGLLGELSPLHIGIGTANPFAMITLPEDLVPKYFWYQLKKRLKIYGVECKNVTCEKNRLPYYGLECKINPKICPTIQVIADVIDGLKNYDIKFRCGPSIDKAFGNNYLSKFACGEIDKNEFLNHYHEELTDYYQKLISSNALIYEPMPAVYGKSNINA